MTIYCLSAAGIPVTTTSLKARRLALRGCLVQVTCGTDRCPPEKRWFAVGIHLQRAAEAAVCNLPQIEPTNAVFARRPLKPAEIETLGLRSGQVLQCSYSKDAIQTVATKTVVEQSS